MITHMAHRLPDGGADLKAKREQLLARLREMKKPVNIHAIQQLQQQQQRHPSHGLAMQARILTNNVVEHLHK